jgi:hypothetical protein
MRLPRLLALLAALAAAPVSGQSVSSSAGPETVSVTVYRDPNRGADQPFNLRWLNGFALVTERRTIDIPEGEADIRFEGVAGGIQPESAIVTGLPDGVVEKNQDAWLLSPGSLLDASLGRRVHIRRTSRATGEVEETEAVIRSGAGGAVVLETPAGIEALRCTGLPETPVYDRVPAGLSARPTLSVRTRSRAAARATVTLSYLASGFDWQADYIAELSPDGSRMDLFAWLTLANGDETGFVRADTQAVAGRLERQAAGRNRPQAPPIALQCWPGGTTTSDLQEYHPPVPMPPPPPAMMDIVVTGSRVARALESPSPITVVTAEQEELGDLKLYRIPEPVTVAAMSQKQVALLRHERVPVDIVYRFRPGRGPDVHATLVTRNRTVERLGVPLPGGQVAFFQTGGGRRVLVGRGRLADRAVGEKVEVEIGASTDVRMVFEQEGEEREEADFSVRTFRLSVTNAKSRPVAFEALLAEESGDLDRSLVSKGGQVAVRDGAAWWVARLPANSTTNVRYTVHLTR